MALGYDGPLFMLAFDHRGARHLPMFGVDGDQDADQRSRISAVKHIVHDGFEMARETAGLGHEAGILVDEEFGADIARRASADGVTVAMPVEVSGLDHFAFEYGEQFRAHLDDFDPKFAKVLVRFNPEGDATKNERSLGRLRTLSDWLRPRSTKLLLELIVPAERHQLDPTGGVDA
jgi:Uncharacterized protein conserved in bacteria